MAHPRLPWQQELDIVDRTMRAISGITDPEELVNTYWNGVGELVPDLDYISISRRGEEPPNFLITRSSLFTEHPNPWTDRHKLPRLSGGLLGEIIYGNKPVIIMDGLKDRLKPDDPAYQYLKGYVGLLALPQYDQNEGVNCTVQMFPPGFEPDPAMIPILHWQAGLFGRGTQNLVLRNRLADALAKLDRELQAVGEIQRSLLPARLPEIPGVEAAAYYLTSARAGGDYYDFFPLEDGRWGIFIADVSGHGTPAAVLMAITHAIAHAKPGVHTPPAKLLTFLNAQLARLYTSQGTFVTAFYAILDSRGRTLTYSAAGHNPPRLVRDGKVIELNEAQSLPLGIEPDQPYDETELALRPGDLLLLYTDGITEAMGPVKEGEHQELFGVQRLDRSLLACAAAAPRACLDRIVLDVAAFTRDAPATDDRTLIAIRMLAR